MVYIIAHKNTSGHLRNPLGVSTRLNRRRRLMPSTNNYGHKKRRPLGLQFLVPGTGLEPALLSEHAPETCASTNSATRASGRVPSLGTWW